MLFDPTVRTFSVAITALSLLIVACAGSPGVRDGSGSSDSPAQIELLVRDGCANSGELERRLGKALATLDSVRLDLAIVDQAALAGGDDRRGYGTPTILVNGKDLYGQPRPTLPYPAPT